MLKKILFPLAAIFLLTACADAGSSIPPDTSAESKPTFSSGTDPHGYLDVVEATNVQPDELDKALQEYTALIDSIVSDNSIDKLQFNVYVMGEAQTYTTTDTNLIDRWISFLKDLEVRPEPFVSYMGLAKDLQFFAGDNAYDWIQFDLPVIRLYNNRVMLRPVNFDHDRFRMLQEEIGYQPHNPTTEA